MKNKVLAGIMAVCLVGGIGVIPETIAPAVSMTANADSAYSDFEYELNADDTAVKITKYTGSDTEVVIPSEIDGIPVTYIGGYAFQENKELTSVVIPDSVTVIGWGSFVDCTALTSVTLSANLKKLDPYAFRGCTNLPGSLVLPESLTSMASGVFWGCSSLTSVSLPKNITTIGANTFYYCTNLESVSFSDDLTAIQEEAFYGCAKLNSITLPETLKSIGDYAFRDCESLTEFIMSDKVETIGTELFENCTSLETVKLSENIKEIPYEAFIGCKSLKEITIPEKVTSFGVNVFSGCTSLKKITVLNSECKLSEYGYLGGNTETVIYGYTDSTAQAYAEKYKYNFVALDGENTTVPDGVVYGDANSDGQVSLADAVLIMQAISNPDDYALTDEQKLSADVVDAGGGLTPVDALAVQMIDLKLISEDDLPITSDELNSILNK